MPPTHTRESVLQGSRDDAAGEGPSHLLGHHAPTVWACPGRGALPDGPYPAFGDGVGVGRARIGVQMLWTPVERQTSSNALVNLVSRSRIRNLNAAARSPRSRRRLRACWATHGPLGWAVTPAMCTRRLPSSMTNSTYSRRSQTVSTVKKSQARMPAACRRRNTRGSARRADRVARPMRWPRKRTAGQPQSVAPGRASDGPMSVVV
jgi:hypothetical protein